MKVAVLSKSDAYYCTRRLLERGGALGHEMELFPVLSGRLQIGAGDPAYWTDGRRSDSLPDAVIARIGYHHPEFALLQLRALEGLRVRALNASAGIGLARDKAQSLLVLSCAGLRVPHTTMVKDLDQIESALAALEVASGTPDVVIKPIHGAQGRGVMLARGRPSARTVLEGLICASHEVLVQEYLGAIKDGDLRLLVLDGRVIAAVRRRPPDGEFRTNVHRGGTAEPLSASTEEAAMAIAATRTLGLRFAGVDLVERSPGEFVVLEVNASPGWEGLERATGIDVAELVIRAIAEDREGARR